MSCRRRGREAPDVRSLSGLQWQSPRAHGERNARDSGARISRRRAAAIGQSRSSLRRSRLGARPGAASPPPSSRGQGEGEAPQRLGAAPTFATRFARGAARRVNSHNERLPWILSQSGTFITAAHSWASVAGAAHTQLSRAPRKVPRNAAEFAVVRLSCGRQRPWPAPTTPSFTQRKVSTMEPLAMTDWIVVAFAAMSIPAAPSVCTTFVQIVRDDIDRRRA